MKIISGKIREKQHRNLNCQKTYQNFWDGVLVVYDTYDFLDKVISFSLSDIFVAAFDQFYIRTNDFRAKDMVNYFRYGTNDNDEIWLMRYGFSIEEAGLIKKFVSQIDENEILFSASIHEQQNESIKKIVERYL